jgi:hypothetical protein
MGIPRRKRKQRDYTKPKRRDDIAVLFAVCVGVLVFFVLKLANISGREFRDWLPSGSWRSR